MFRSLHEGPPGLMSRRELLAVFATGVAVGCSKPGNLLVSPAIAQKPGTASRFSRRITVYEAASASFTRSSSPLGALDALRKPYSAAVMAAGLFVTAVSGQEGSWVFALDGTLPDWFGGGAITRLGKVTLSSPADVRRYLPGFRRGTIGLSLMDYDWQTIVEDGAVLDSVSFGSRPTAETVFQATPSAPVLVTWLRVGTLLPEAA